MKTLGELMAEYEPERLAAIARDDTPEARARAEAKREAEIASEIRRGLRDADGNWIEVPEADDEDEADEEYEGHRDGEDAERGS